MYVYVKATWYVNITAQQQRLWLRVSATASDSSRLVGLGLISSRRERTAALHRSPQNNAFGAIAVQFWCILSYIRLLKQSKNVLGDGRLGGGPQPPPPLNTPLTGKELQLFRLWSWTLERRRQLNNSSISNNRNVIMSLAIIVSVN